MLTHEHRMARAALAVLITVSWATPVHAQVTVGIRGSTLGAGVEVSVRPARAIGLRASGNLLTFTRDQEVAGISYELEPRLRSVGASVDLYPFGKVLYLSGGLLVNGNEASAEAIIGETITIGTRTFTNAEVQSLRGDLEWNRSVAPYAGLGFTTGGRVGLGLELGVVFSGTPTVALSGQTTLSGAERAEFENRLAQEEEEIRDWIDDNRRWTQYYPVLALGLRIQL